MVDLGTPLVLPCGLRLQNRVVKSAMSDSLGDGRGNPTASQIRLYQRWAHGGVGLQLIGEVQVFPQHLEKPGNLALVPDLNVSLFQELAAKGSENGTHIWPQLGHAGALTYAPAGRALGPSPLELEGLVCEGMSLPEISALPIAFARAAKIAQDMGFSGVQVHAGHGFLLSQFLSPLFNHRIDAYGGPIEHRARLLIESIAAIRAEVGAEFAIGTKINCTDQIDGGITNAEALALVDLLDQTSLDLIEVSGGTYFPGAPASSDRATAGEPYFLKFTAQAKARTSIPLVTTGGFKTFAQAHDAVHRVETDGVGLGRALIVHPDLTKHWAYEQATNPRFPRFSETREGAVTAWYTLAINALGNDEPLPLGLEANEALDTYDQRDEERTKLWLDRFGSA